MTNYYTISTGQFGYPQPEDNYEELTYSPNLGCQTCQIGNSQISEFRFRGTPKPLKNDFTGLNWVFDQIFARQKVKNLFEEEGISGIEYTIPVDHKTGTNIPEFYQLRVGTILPPSLLNTDLKSETCEYPKNDKMLSFLITNGSRLVKGPFCGNSKFNFPIGQTLKFKKEAFINQPDFLRTFEWFGSGGSGNRPILVSERAKKIIESNKLRGVQFEPVELE